MFKTLLKQIGDYKKDAILTPVFVVMEVIMEVIIPIMMAAVIDYGLADQNMGRAGLVTRMTTDVMNVQQAFQMSIRICVRAPIMLISAMAMTFLIHPRFALIFLVVIIALAAVLALISSKANPTLRKVFHEYDELNAKVQENVNGMRVV